jgi:hypothetical protein
LAQEFKSNPEKIWNEVCENGYEAATFKGLEGAREITRQMKESGFLRPSHRCKWVKIRDPLGRWPKRIWWKAVPSKASTRAFRMPQDVPIWATPVYSLFRAIASGRR